ncbi:MAG TPA: oxygenase MpaB family protein, partial [Actinomycetota bacterium]|nr:oxygenase MpaB family protein [Actinomycetota bacterium]
MERHDPGLFGPDSVSWRVLREASVMIGGVRALLMHAAHPLVVAGARQTGMYEHDPWRRLERTLRLTFTVVFGTEQEARAAAKRIDDVHAGIHGVDPVTGLRYDARDPELLLWVHACLVTSFLELERLTIGRLDDAGRQRFHQEQLLTVEPLRLPRERVPPTIRALEAYVDEVIGSGVLRRTDGADSVAALVRDPPAQVPRRRLWRIVSFLAFATLPAPLRELYGVDHGPLDELRKRVLCGGMRLDRPIMPPRMRFIAPAILAGA